MSWNNGMTLDLSNQNIFEKLYVDSNTRDLCPARNTKNQCTFIEDFNEMISKPHIDFSYSSKKKEKKTIDFIFLKIRFALF